MTPTFILVTMPGCNPCKVLKAMLDKLEYEDSIQLNFHYEIQDASRADEFVKEYDIQSVPTLIAPSGNKLEGLRKLDDLRRWVGEEAVRYQEEVRG